MRKLYEATYNPRMRNSKSAFFFAESDEEAEGIAAQIAKEEGAGKNYCVELSEVDVRPTHRREEWLRKRQKG